MRLIDANVLKTDLTRFYNNEVTAKRLIDEQPIVEAIPVEWLKKQAKDNYDYSGTLIRGLLSEWQKEQEAHDGEV